MLSESFPTPVRRILLIWRKLGRHKQEEDGYEHRQPQLCVGSWLKEDDGCRHVPGSDTMLKLQYESCLEVAGSFQQSTKHGCTRSKSGRQNTCELGGRGTTISAIFRRQKVSVPLVNSSFRSSSTISHHQQRPS